MNRFIYGLTTLTLLSNFGCKSRQADTEGALERELPEPQSMMLAVAEDSGRIPGSQETGDATKPAPANAPAVTGAVAARMSTSTTNRTVLNEANVLVREIQLQNRSLSTSESNSAINSIRNARDIVAGRGQQSDILCMPSTSRPGKACMKQVRGDNSCLGNYFDSVALCKESLRTAKNGRACFQSDRYTGKGLISLYGQNTTTSLIGNYYSTFNNCITSLRDSYGYLVCMESARYTGRWFIADLDNNGNQVGGYFNSYAACQQTF